MLYNVREWLIRHLFGRRGLVRHVNGTTLRVDPQTRWQFNGSYDAAIAETVRRLVRPGDIIWNVGANVGVHVLQLCPLVGPAGRVVAFEPNPVAADLIAKNVALNDFTDRVTIVRSAVGQQASQVEFFSVGAEPMGRPGMANPQLADTVPIQVPMVTMDQAAVEYGRPAGIVMDIEGWEVAALLSAHSLMTGPDAPWIVMETHPEAWAWSGHTRADLENLIEERGLVLTPLAGSADPLVTQGHVLLTAKPSTGQPQPNQRG